jgi:hypothetical protein
MQHLLKALRGAARAEVVATELLGQLLVAVHDPESAPNLRLGRVSLSSVYLMARKEGRLSNSLWCAISGLLSKPRAAGSWLFAWPGGQGRGVSQKWAISAGGRRPAANRRPSVQVDGRRWSNRRRARPRASPRSARNRSAGSSGIAGSGPLASFPAPGRQGCAAVSCGAD